MSITNKENIANFNLKWIDGGKPRSRFGSLLKNASKQIQEENDNNVAIDAQADEIIGVMKEWMQENDDIAQAKELAESLDEEDKATRRLEILKGESEALRIAVEEKRRLKAFAEARFVREKEDEDFAKRLAVEEENEIRQQREEFLKADEKLCRQLSEDFGEEKSRHVMMTPIAESKRDSDGIVRRYNPQTATPQTKELSDTESDDDYGELECDEDDDDDTFAREEKDEEECKLDEGEWKRALAHAEQALDDEIMARKTQHAWEEEYKSTKEEQEEKDRRYSQRLALMDERRIFMQKQQVANRFRFEHTSQSEVIIRKLWNDADAEVDNAGEAICLTILLPALERVAVKTLANTRTGPVLRIEAQRLVAEKKSRFHDHARYVAEFQLDAGGSSVIKLGKSDYYYEYSSESGLLHVFIDNISLDKRRLNSMAAVAENEGTSGKGSTKIATAMISGLKSGLMRVFGGKKNNNNANDNNKRQNVTEHK